MCDFKVLSVSYRQTELVFYCCKVTLPLGFDGMMLNSWRGHDSRRCFNKLNVSEEKKQLPYYTPKCVHLNYLTLEVDGDISAEQKSIMRKKQGSCKHKGSGFLCESLSLILVHTFCCRPRPMVLFNESRCTLPESMWSGASHREVIRQPQVLINLTERLPKHTWGHGQPRNHWISHATSVSVVVFVSLFRVLKAGLAARECEFLCLSHWLANL